MTIDELSPKALQQISKLLDARLDAKFEQQAKWFELRFQEERQYYRQLIRQELKRIEDQIKQLKSAESEDVVALAGDIKRLERRQKKLEQQFVLLQV